MIWYFDFEILFFVWQGVLPTILWCFLRYVRAKKGEILRSPPDHMTMIFTINPSIPNKDAVVTKGISTYRDIPNEDRELIIIQSWMGRATWLLWTCRLQCNIWLMALIFRIGTVLHYSFSKLSYSDIQFFPLSLYDRLGYLCAEKECIFHHAETMMYQ